MEDKMTGTKQQQQNISKENNYQEPNLTKSIGIDISMNGLNTQNNSNCSSSSSNSSNSKDSEIYIESKVQSENSNNSKGFSININPESASNSGISSSNSNISNNAHRKYDHMIISHKRIPFIGNLSRKENRALFYILDWVFCIVLGFIGALIFYYVPVRGRLFTLDDKDISYPFLEEIVPFPHLIVYAAIIPVIIVSGVNLLFTRNLTDFHHGLMGLLQSIAVTLLLVASFKSFIGGLRPNFLSVCNPSQELIEKAQPQGFGGIYYNSDICTASKWEINDALSAYPSGHAAIAAAGLFYLALYLYAKLKVFYNRGHLIVYAIVLMCVIGFLLIGITRIADYRHTFGNVVCGWIIGIFISISMYKLNYMSLIGNDNHIPIAFSYEHDD
ncbi:phosphoesterase [Tieghemostelium lacteum]|uniref:Phosphoesterase n=1 Tax=Tieghemostelium lacteum TaxID=361077 RepID=A0A151ZE72_TIELA|nr:phosphoesterase [Tieghemostelium lacteum]|eukprot:KYQ92210.1 phosphoesterase [Tieghemostelium lacteum]